jgi:hypothetical protein
VNETGRTLTDADIEAVAVAVADKLAARLALPGPPADGLVGVAEVAKRIGMGEQWVREHADELGGRRIGNGEKPRHRFDLAEVERRMAREADLPKPTPVRHRRRPSSGGVDLLPVRGRD